MNNNRDGALGANPDRINPEGMNELMDGMSYEQPEEEPAQPQGHQYQQPAQQQPVQQQQMTPPPAPTQYQNPEMGSIIPHYAKGGQTKEKRKMKNMPDLSLIDQRPGYEGEQEDSEMIVAHVGANELKKLDEMQGGRRIDDETGLPIYDGLVPFIGTPELMEIFKDVVYEIAETGTLSPDKAEFISQLDPLFPLANKLPVDGPPSEHEDFAYPEEEELAEKGLAGDHELALIPRALADMLDEIRGETSTNPKTGLPQYFWFIPALIGAVALGAKVWGDYKSQAQYAKDLKKSQEEYERKQKEEIEKQETYHKGLVKNYLDRTENFSKRFFKPTEEVDNILSDQQGAA